MAFPRTPVTCQLVNRLPQDSSHKALPMPRCTCWGWPASLPACQPATSWDSGGHCEMGQKQCPTSSVLLTDRTSKFQA